MSRSAPVLELSYASSSDEGDVVAEAALVKAYRFILITGSFATIVWLSRASWSCIARGHPWNHLEGLLYANGIALILAYFCLRAFRSRSKWLNSILWVSFLLWLNAEAPWAGSWRPLGWALLDLVSALVMKLPLAIFLLCYPLLRGRPTESWIQRLNAMCVVMFCLYAAYWLNLNLHLAIRAAYGLPSIVKFYPMAWQDAGMVVVGALLFLYGRRLNRLLIFAATGYYLFYASRDLQIRNYHATMSAAEYFADVYYQQVAEFLKKLAAALPLAMLLWFSFRFDRSERRLLSQPPGDAALPPLADPLANA